MRVAQPQVMNVRDMLLSIGGGCSLKIRGTVKAGGVTFLCKSEFGECVEQRPRSWQVQRDRLGWETSSCGLKVLLLVVMSLLWSRSSRCCSDS